MIPESRRHPQQFLYLGSRNNNSFHNGDNSRQLQKIEEEKQGVGMGGGRESIDFTCVVQHKRLHNLDPFLPLSIYLHRSFLPRFLSLTTPPQLFLANLKFVKPGRLLDRWPLIFCALHLLQTSRRAWFLLTAAEEPRLHLSCPGR